MTATTSERVRKVLELIGNADSKVFNLVINSAWPIGADNQIGKLTDGEFLLLISNIEKIIEGINEKGIIQRSGDVDRIE